MKNYISNKVLSTDESTGLSVELRTKSINIDAETRTIHIKVDKCLVSPTGVEMKVLEQKYYTRYDSETNTKYSNLEASPLGLGIKGLLALDLDLYPDLEQA